MQINNKNNEQLVEVKSLKNFFHGIIIKKRFLPSYVLSFVLKNAVKELSACLCFIYNGSSYRFNKPRGVLEEHEKRLQVMSRRRVIYKLLECFSTSHVVYCTDKS